MRWQVSIRVRLPRALTEEELESFRDEWGTAGYSLNAEGTAYHLQVIEFSYRGTIEKAIAQVRHALVISLVGLGISDWQMESIMAQNRTYS